MHRWWLTISLLVCASSPLFAQSNLRLALQPGTPTSPPTVTVSWDKNSEPDIAAYTVFLGSATHTYGPGVDVSPTTLQYTAPATPGQMVFAALQARDAAGDKSPLSNEVSTQVPASTTTAKFKVGDWVISIDNFNVRSAPGLTTTVLENKPAGSTGTVIAGPTVADGSNWYRVDYATGADGWTGEERLTLQTIPPPPTPCTLTVNDHSFTLPAAGGSGAVTATVSVPCTWTASSSAPWLTLSPTSGANSGTVTFSALLNTQPSRTASITISTTGKTETISVTQPQAPLPPPPPPPVDPCLQKPSVTPDRSWDNKLRLGQTGRIGFTLKAPAGRLITRFQIQVGTDVWTSDLTNGAFFSGAAYTPTKIGVLPLNLSVWDDKGCFDKTASLRTVTVQ